MLRVMVMSFLITIDLCKATHFAFGTVSWSRPDVNIIDNNQILFRTEMAWRLDYPHWRNHVGGRTPRKDDVIQPGEYIWKRGGSKKLTDKIYLYITNISPINEQNWLQGRYEWEFPKTEINNPGPWDISFKGCCRVSNIMENNNDKDYKMNARFVFEKRASGLKTTKSSAREYFETNKPVYFKIPVHPLDSEVTFSFQTRSLSGLKTQVPGSTFGNPLILDQTGSFTWQPTTIGLYAVCIKISENSPPPGVSNSDTESIILDFIIQVLDDCSTDPSANCAPYFFPLTPELLNPRSINPRSPYMSPQLFYRNIESSFTIVAEDKDLLDYPTVETSASIPSNADCSFFSKGDKLHDDNPGSRVTYVCSWTPGLSDVDQNVCFSASDTKGKGNFGNYCIVWKIDLAPFLYVSGIIRDFKSDTPDFDHTSNDGPLSSDFVEDNLGSDGKPVYKSGSNVKSVQDASSFSQWFNDVTDVNKKMVLSRTLSDINGFGIYKYETTNFHPINNLLWDQEQLSSGDNNLFTWEVHTYVTINHTHTLSFKTADDFWLFIDGKKVISLPGIKGKNPATGSVNMATLNGLKEGDTYRCDFFYACRSESPSISLELPEGFLCNALAPGTGSVEIDLSLKTDVPLTERGSPPPKIDAVRGLTLLREEAVSGSIGAAWFAEDTSGLTQSVLVKILKGFEVEFNFNAQTNGAPNCEGFAFVMQNDRATADGNPGQELGYGGIKNSLAVEFDMRSDAYRGGPNYEHVAVHSALKFDVGNDAGGESMLGESITPIGVDGYDINIAPPLLDMTNGSLHKVIITYTPPQQVSGTTNRIDSGWLRVYMGDVLAPFVEVQIKNSDTGAIFPSGAAYVGFTSSSSAESEGCSINILNWKTTIVTIDPRLTFVSQSLTTGMVGQDVIMTIQSKDACGNELQVGEDHEKFTVVVRKHFGKKEIVTKTASLNCDTCTPTIVTSNHDGTYQLKFSTTLAAYMEVHIKYGDTPIQGSPKLISINPGPTSSKTSTWEIGELDVKRSNDPRVGNETGIYLVRFDLDGTVSTNDGQFVWMQAGAEPSFPLSKGIVAAVMYFGTLSSRSVSWFSSSEKLSTYVDGQSWCFISENGQRKCEDLVTDDKCSCIYSKNGFNIIASAAGSVTGFPRGYINSIQRVDSNNQERYRFFASQTNEAKFVIIARDQFGNLVGDRGDQFSYDFSIPVNTLLPPDGTWDSGYYLCKWSSVTAGHNDLYVRLSNENILMSPGAIKVLALRPNKKTSTATGTGLIQAIAGNNAIIELNLFDKFGNRLSEPPDTGLVTGYLKGPIPREDKFNFTKLWNSDFLGSEYYAWTYNLKEVGDYKLIVLIQNNNSIDEEMESTIGHKITIKPGPAYAPNCEANILNYTVEAGTAYQFSMQARDRFKNDITLPEEETTFDVKASITSLATASISYADGGLYAIDYSYDRTGNYKLRVYLGDTNIGLPEQPANGYDIKVIPGRPSFNSKLEFTSTSGTAGEYNTFDIISIDSKGNNRMATNADKEEFIITISSQTAIIQNEDMIITANVGTNTFNVNWNATVADTYTIRVVTKSDGETVIDSGTTVKINPGLTSIETSGNPSGSGSRSGVSGTEVVMYIQAKDRFSNNQIRWDNFIATLDESIQLTVQNQTNGRYKVLYTIPLKIPGKTDYIIEYSLGTELVWKKTLKIFSDAAEVIVRAPNCETNFSFNASVDINFITITHVDRACQAIDSQGNFDAVITNSKAQETQAEIRKRGGNMGEYDLSFQFKKADIYTIEFYLFSKAEVLNDCTSCTGGQRLDLIIEPNEVFGPNCNFKSLITKIEAGQKANILVTLRDKYSNVIKRTNHVVSVIDDRNKITSQSSSYSESNENWSVQYIIKEAGAYNIDVLVDSSKKTIVAIPVFVEHSAVSAIESTVHGLNGKIVAGQPTQFRIQLRDQYNNSISNYKQFEEIKTMPNSTMGNSMDFVYSEFGNGEYVAHYTPTKSGSFLLNVVLPSQEPIGTLVVDVFPAIFNNQLSKAIMPGNGFAGEALSFILQARDTYGNPWGETSADANRIVVVGTDRFGRIYPASTSVADGLSNWKIELDPTQTQLAGEYSFTLRIDGIVQEIDDILPVTVLPADIDASFSQVPDKLDNILVNEVKEVSIFLRDRFGNDAGNFMDSLANLSFFSFTECTVNENINSSTRILDTGFSQLDGYNYDITNSQLTFKYQSFKTGTFAIVFSYNSTEFDCFQIERMQQTVLSGRAIAHNSVVLFSSVPKYLRAGMEISFDVVLKDFSANPIDSAFNYEKKINISSNYYYYSNLIVQTTQDVSKYKVIFTTACAGNHTVNVMLKDSPEDGDSPQLIPGGGIIVVRPGDVTSFQIPAFSGRETDTRREMRCYQHHTTSFVFVAAMNSFFDLVGVDEFGNTVETNMHSYNIKFTIKNPDNGYSFIPEVMLLPGQPGWHRASFMSSWDGMFEASIALEQPSSNLVKYDVSIEPSLCPNSQKRCLESNNCVSNYKICNNPPFRPCTSPKVLCFDNTCSSQCPCPPGLKRCPTGNCAADCFTIGQTCSSEKPQDCPSTRVCPLGAFMCPNTMTCVVNETECFVPPINDTCKRCWDGTCATSNSIRDCPTRKTCLTGLVCPDGSCTDDAIKCAQLVSCDPYPIRCPDGTCSERFSDCPSNVVCIDGYVLCENNFCAQTLDDCIDSIPCTGAESWKCSDGSCARNILLCPSKVTCSNTKPVLCPDHSCVTSSFYCPSPSEPSACLPGQLTCPDGSCISSKGGQLPACPTSKICKHKLSNEAGSELIARPVLCPDGHCYQSRVDCQPIPACWGVTPVHCPDTSCSSSLQECPTQVSCPPNYPVHCLNGQCAASSSDCVDPDLLRCSGNIQCPGGECADSRALCPTHLTCLPTSSRCVDGTCRTSCDIPNKNMNTDKCGPGLIECPAASIGIACASSLDECPKSPVCPSATPVRCLEAACESTTEYCNYPDDNEFDETRIACPDGTWTRQIESCFTPTICTSTFPFKCFDGSCRASPEACPKPIKCPKSAPYLCPNGKCMQDLSDPDCFPACSFGNECQCPLDRPVRCAGSERCAFNLDMCTTELHDCSINQIRCKNGFCADSASSCEDLQCPTELPYRCSDGLCTWDPSRCNDPKTGCLWYQTYEVNGQMLYDRCWDGKCRRSGMTDQECYESKRKRCVDGKIFCPGVGVCAFSGKCPSRSNGCPTNFVRCLDKSCVPKPSLPYDPNNQDTYSECIKGSKPSNACPYNAPFRCVSGYCAMTESRCPEIPDYCSDVKDTNGVHQSISCADGSCAYTADQCPTVHPCEGDTPYRCQGDGSCVNDLDLCFVANLCPSGYKTRCNQTGLCVADSKDCVNSNTGCPFSFDKCSNGVCSKDQAIYVANCSMQKEICLNNTSGNNAGAKVCNDQYDACMASDPCSKLTAPVSGCDTTTKELCWNGACVAKGSCPFLSGCPRTGGPFRCPDGSCASDVSACSSEQCSEFQCADGACLSNATECQDANGCPVVKPIRCANGECKKYPMSAWKSRPSDVCTIVVGCREGQFLCYSGKCVESQEFCGPSTIADCENGKLCPNGECISISEDCSRYCPTNAPVMCSNGECTVQIQDCPREVIGAVSVGNTSDVDRFTGIDAGCSDQKPKKCYDGFCDTYINCINRRFRVEGSKLDSSLSAVSTRSCDGGTSAMCSDGSCMPTIDDCPIVQRCPFKFPFRCWNGECKQNADQCPPGSKCLDSTLNRCEDGSCRAVCLHHDGCSLQEPYHCDDRECAKSRAECADQEQITSPHPCYINCKSQVKASLFQYTVDPTKDLYIDFAIDSANHAIGHLKIPSGALSIEGGMSAISIRPVADSVLRETVNNLPADRYQDFGGKKSLSFHETLLSVAFECRTNTQQNLSKFIIKLTFDAEIDYTRKPEAKDICLAYVFQIPVLKYSRWKCVHGLPANRKLFPVSVEGTDAPQKVTGVISDCQTEETIDQSQNRRLLESGNNEVSGKIYAFIHAPVPNPKVTPKKPKNPFLENLFVIVIVILICVVIALMIFYAIRRLHRYREKLLEERAALTRAEERKDNLEIHGHDGTEDDLQITQNPMMLQVQNVQNQINESNQKIQAEEQSALQDASDERLAHINNLKEDRNALNDELKKLQAQLEGQQKLQQARKPLRQTQEDFSATADAPFLGSSDSGAINLSIPSPTASKPNQRQFLSPTGPKRKKHIQ